jgi:hypothetical protein
MLRILLLQVAILLSSIAQAEELTSRLVDFVPASENGDMALAYLESGRVLRISATRSSNFQIASLSALIGKTDRLRITFNDLGDEDEILDLHRLPPPAFHPENSPPSLTTQEGIEPQAPSATKLFSFLVAKKLRKSSQCFERAYLWSHQMQKSFGLSSGKVFVFFSPDFIKKNRFRWWFHVAPTTSVGQQGLVLDATYTTGPRTVQGWLDDITPVRVNCQTITTFAGKPSLPRKPDCVLRYTNMYVFGSNHLRQVDQKGRLPAGWMPWALNQSKRNTKP